MVGGGQVIEPGGDCCELNVAKATLPWALTTCLAVV